MTKPLQASHTGWYCSVAIQLHQEFTSSYKINILLMDIFTDLKILKKIHKIANYPQMAMTRLDSQ